MRTQGQTDTFARFLTLSQPPSTVAMFVFVRNTELCARPLVDVLPNNHANVKDARKYVYVWEFDVVFLLCATVSINLGALIE